MALKKAKYTNKSKFYVEQIISGKIKIENPTFAYEPESAIGTGTPENFDKISQTIDQVRDCASADNLKFKVLYGGSVNSKNIEPLLEIDSLSGFLIGSASLDYNDLKKMLELAEHRLTK